MEMIVFSNASRHDYCTKSKGKKKQKMIMSIDHISFVSMTTAIQLGHRYQFRRMSKEQERERKEEMFKRFFCPKRIVEAK
jgi:hypothetical protein